MGTEPECTNLDLVVNAKNFPDYVVPTIPSSTGCWWKTLPVPWKHKAESKTKELLTGKMD